MDITRRKSYEIDMTTGSFFKKIILFSLPLILSGILQLLYNAADLMVVGKFGTEPNAVGAVGSTTSLISLLVNLFLGLSVGANVLSARSFASKNNDKLSKTVHTSVSISVLAGVVLGIVGIIFAEDFLKMMSNPNELAVIYLRIYFIGMPFNLLYNFAASILRGVGDTKRPLYYLTISGAVNVVLNLFFVLVLKMNVEGVAIATISSQVLSCVLIMNCLIKSKEAYHFDFKKVHIHKKELFEIIKIGLPAGIQGSLFSISNVLIQSSVNKFGNLIINGNATAQSIEGFVYTSMNSIATAALSFTGQNMGVKKYRNIKTVLLYSVLIVSMIGIGLGGGLFIFGKQISQLYGITEAEMEITYLRLHYLCLPYFLCGIMDVMVGVLRGMGYSLIPMAVSILGICGFRVLWIYTVFNNFVDYNNFQTLHYLYISYPISWIMTFTAHFTLFLIVYLRILKKQKKEMVYANN